MNTEKSTPIDTWQEFAKKVRSQGCNLLGSIENFPGSIVVTGCQRSGTTAIARIIKSSSEICNVQLCKDDELSDALLLSGQAKINSNGRCCFQTTFLNECLAEYKKLTDEHRLVWVIRNPYSVV